MNFAPAMPERVRAPGRPKPGPTRPAGRSLYPASGVRQ